MNNNTQVPTVGRKVAVVGAYYAAAGISLAVLNAAGIQYNDPRIMWAGIPHMVLLAAFAWWVTRGGDPVLDRRQLRWRWDRTPLFLVPVVTALIVVAVFVEAGARNLLSPLLVATLVLTCLIGFAEEVVFRRFLLQGADLRAVPGRAALLLAGATLAFGAAHMVNIAGGIAPEDALQQSLGSLGFGLVAGFLLLVTRNILALVCWHMSIDFGLMVSNTGDFYSPGILGLLMDAVIVIALVMCLVRVARGAWTRRRPAS